MWFRRNLDEFDVDWTFSEGFFSPVILRDLQPWRNHPLASECHVIPKELALLVADQDYMAKILRSDWEDAKMSSLRESILNEGLREPLTMVYDSGGKLRYHDGYHRLCILQEIGHVKSIPVFLQYSPRVKGYGRPIGVFVPEIFQLFSGLCR